MIVSGQRYELSYLHYAENQFESVIPQEITQESEIFLPSHELIITASGEFLLEKEARNKTYLGPTETPEKEVFLSQDFVEKIANIAKLALEHPEDESTKQKVEAIKKQIRLYFQDSSFEQNQKFGIVFGLLKSIEIENQCSLPCKHSVTVGLYQGPNIKVSYTKSEICVLIKGLGEKILNQAENIEHFFGSSKVISQASQERNLIKAHAILSKLDENLKFLNEERDLEDAADGFHRIFTIILNPQEIQEIESSFPPLSHDNIF